MKHPAALMIVPLTLVLIASPASAQPAAPKPPAEYNVHLRYQIDAFRNEHVVQFDEMVNFLKSIGFNKVSEYENERESREVNRMLGTIASANARRLLNERHVRTILLIPPDAKLPAEADQPVRVQVELPRGVEPRQQRLLADQVRSVLAELGFREAVAYDHRGNTRLVGMIGVGRLDTLLNDLRKQPVGASLPAPFARVTPIRVIEVLPGMEPIAERPALPEVPKEWENIAPNLRALLGDQEAAARPARMEVILAYTPASDDVTWMRQLRQAAPGLLIDGRLGQLVSVQGLPEQAPALAVLPIVSAVRLPMSARPRATDTPPPADVKEALRASGLHRLHEQGFRGKGVRVALIDADFRGWEDLVGKQLPAGTTLIDLTRERNRNLEPDPVAGDPQELGHGTRFAEALMQAAPEASLTLIRIDPAAPYQLLEVARSINGEFFRSLSMEARRDEMQEDHNRLEVQRPILAEERRAILDLTGDPDEFKKRWDEYQKKQEEFNQAERYYEARMTRYLQLHREMRGLKGIAVAASPLSWNEGHPVDGTSDLSRYFDDRPFKAALWFQSAGDTHGQAWTGLFRDADGNNVMEFTSPETPLPEGRWTPELNFLAWRPAAKADDRGGSPEIPAQSRLRVSVQWREAHNPDFLRRGEDAYRVPLADLRLVVLRQRDPSGTNLPADDFEVVAQSVGLPVRLDNQPSAGTYEQSVEFTAETGGRYVVRIEGRAPTGTWPRGVPTLPAADKASDLHLRVFVQTLSGPGRAVFADFTSDRPDRTEGGSLGMPAEARQVITVGAADRTGRPLPFSAVGPPMSLDLLTKPDVLYTLGDSGETHGTGLATSFAAGLAASAITAGAPRNVFLEALQVQPGCVLQIPECWPARVR